MNNFRPKKSLGQNFLKSKEIVEEIVSVSEISKNDTVLEIGPGKGILTDLLLRKARKVIAIEKDASLIPVLKKQFEKVIAEHKLELVEGDVLSYNFGKILRGDYKVVANIPYYITGQILRTFLNSDNKPVSMTLMLQKEVAERIVARDGKESILSLSVKAYGDPKYEFSVKKEEFSPVPKVDSAVLSIKNISNSFFIDKTAEKRFFSLIKQGFSSKRRKLINNLKNSGLKEEELKIIFTKLNLTENTRAERLTMDDWKAFLV